MLMDGAAVSRRSCGWDRPALIGAPVARWDNLLVHDPEKGTPLF
jgi:hypothetical protein